MGDTKLSERIYDGEFDVEVGEEVCMADKRVIAEVRALEQALEEAQKANKNLKVQRDTIVANARAEREGLEAALEEARADLHAAGERANLEIAARLGLQAELAQACEERDAAQAEAKRSTKCLSKANDCIAKYERKYYLTLNERDAALERERELQEDLKESIEDEVKALEARDAARLAALRECAECLNIDDTVETYSRIEALISTEQAKGGSK